MIMFARASLSVRHSWFADSTLGLAMRNSSLALSIAALCFCSALLPNRQLSYARPPDLAREDLNKPWMTLVDSWHTTSKQKSLVLSVRPDGWALVMWMQEGQHSIDHVRWKPLSGGILIQDVPRIRLWHGRHDQELRAEIEAAIPALDYNPNTYFHRRFMMRRVGKRAFPQETLDRPIPQAWTREALDKDWDATLGRQTSEKGGSDNVARQSRNRTVTVRLEPVPEGECKIGLTEQGSHSNGQPHFFEFRPLTGGAATFDSVAPGRYITISTGIEPFGTPYYPPRLISVAEHQEHVSITLKPGPVRVEGRVEGTMPGNRSYYVTFSRLDEPEIPHAVSSSELADDGSYELSGLLPGSYLASVTWTRDVPHIAIREHGISDARRVTLDAGNNAVMLQLPRGEISGRVEGDLPMRVPGEIQPMVVARMSPVANVAGVLNEAHVEIKRDGSFNLNHVPVGTYVVNAMWPCLHSTPFAGEVVKITRAAPTVDVVLKASQKNGAVSGVIDGVTPLPSAAAGEDVRRWSLTAYRKHDGQYRFVRPMDFARVDWTNMRFQFPALPEGTYGVLVRPEAPWQMPRQPVTTWLPDVGVQSSGIRELTIDIAEARTVRFEFALTDRMPTLARWDLVLPSGDELPMEAFPVSKRSLNGFVYPGRVHTRLAHGNYSIGVEFGELGQYSTSFQVGPGKEWLSVLLFPDRPAQITTMPKPVWAVAGGG
jgi:hypothetical protein